MPDTLSGVLKSPATAMRICQVIPFFYPSTQFGGTVTQTKLLCDELAHRGHDVHVVTTDLGQEDRGLSDRWVNLNGYRVWYSSCAPYARIAPYFNRRLAAPLAELASEIDIAHLQTGLTYINSVAVRELSKRKIPLVYTPNGCLDPRRLHIKRLAKMAFLKWVERPVIAHVNRLSAVCEPELEYFARQGCPAEKMVRIPNGVKPPDLTDVSRQRAAFRQRWGIPADAFTILFLGQLVWFKGIPKLMEQVARLVPEFSQLQLVLAGPDAGMQTKAQALVQKHQLQNHVTFTGHLHEEQKWEAFAAADCFSLLSESEGLPLAILEAAAAGVPAIVTRECNAEDLERYDAGWTTSQFADDIHAAFREAIRNPELLAQKSDNALRMTREATSIAAVANQFLDTYEALIHESQQIAAV